MDALLGLSSATPAAPEGLTASQKLTPVQKAALQKLHTVATQLEGVFVGMMLKEMQSSVPDSSLYGSSPTETTFTEMLNDQRAQSMAQSGTLGVGKIIEQQLRTSVLGNASQEAKIGVPAAEGL